MVKRDSSKGGPATYTRPVLVAETWLPLTQVFGPERPLGKHKSATARFVCFRVPAVVRSVLRGVGGSP